MHMTMPGFADLFEDDKLFHNSIAMPIALKFTSPEAIDQAGIRGIESHLIATQVRYQSRTIERIVAWSGLSKAPSAHLGSLSPGEGSKNLKPLVVLESTTYPGTTDEDLRTALESDSGLTAGIDFHLAFSPERDSRCSVWSLGGQSLVGWDHLSRP